MQRGLWITVMAAFALLASAPANAETEAECGTAGAPPCGWIAPLLDLIMDDKPACGTGYILGAEMDPADCMTPPPEGQPLVMTGTFRLYWELCEEATYLNDAQDDIVVTFSGTNGNPQFIDFSIEPSTFTLDTATLFNPQYIVTEDRDGATTCWYDYRQPVTLTFERNGDPTADDIQKIQNQNCIAQYYVKIQSDESGERFKTGWAIEPFRFHMLNDPLGESICSEGKSTPAVGAPVFVAGLAALALAVRRR